MENPYHVPLIISAIITGLLWGALLDRFVMYLTYICIKIDNKIKLY